MCFQWFVAPKGRKVGSLKRRVRSHVAKWEMKIARRCGAKHVSESNCKKHTRVGPIVEVEISKMCTPMWREAHFQVKMYKAHQGRSTFGSCDVEKVGAAAAQSTFPSQNVQNTPCSEHFWNLRCWKCERSCGAKHISKSKVLKTDRFGALLDAQMWFCVAGARDCAPCQKWAKRDGFLAFPKKMAGVGRVWRGSGKMHFPWQRSTRDMFIRDVRRWGRWFPEKGCIWSIRSSGLLKWFAWQVQHFVWPGIAFFVAGAILQRHGWKNCKTHCTRPSALHSTFQNWRKSRRIASFWMLPTSKIEEVSQNCLLPTSKIEKVSQNCFLFDVTKCLAELLRFSSLQMSDR